MDVEQLLDEEARYKILIIRYLEFEKNNYLTLGELADILSLSKFKLSNYLDSLTLDLGQFETNPRFEISEKGEFFIQNIDLGITKRLRTSYFKESKEFSLLTKIIEEQINIEQFSEENYLSVSRAYVKRKAVNKFLGAQEIKLKKNSIIGEEFHIRNVLFSLYFEIFNGIEFPFSEKIYLRTKKIISYLEHFADLKLASTKRTKLELLIGIVLCRLLSKNFITENFFATGGASNLVFQEMQASLLSLIDVSAPEEQLLNEISYIFLFLTLEKEVPENFIVQMEERYFREIDELSIKIANQVFELLPLKSEANQQEIKNNFFKEIKIANRKHTIFDFKLSSFTSKGQVDYFLETYPAFSKVVREVIFTHRKDLKFGDPTLTTRLFYDYIFTLIDTCPIQFVENPVYICIDFSDGELYTNYIISQVKGFKNLNIIIEKRVSSVTDLYISDCLIEKFSSSQILWKNPPSPDDWEEFGNSIVRIKKKKEQSNQ